MKKINFIDKIRNKGRTKPWDTVEGFDGLLLGKLTNDVIDNMIKNYGKANSK